MHEPIQMEDFLQVSFQAWPALILMRSLVIFNVNLGCKAAIITVIACFGQRIPALLMFS